MSIEEYSAALTKSLGPLQTALKDLAEARKYKGLPKRVTAAGSAADEAGSALGAIQPPVEVTAEHGQLVAALSSFAGALSSVGDDVGGRELCTGSAVRASLGDAGGTDDLRKALAAVVAKLPGDKPSLKLPAADLKAGSRLSNGDFIRTGKRSGQAELAIDNGGATDAVVTLSRGDKPAIAVYVRKGKDVTVKGVPDGNYTVYFTGGSGWDVSRLTRETRGRARGARREPPPPPHGEPAVLADGGRMLIRPIEAEDAQQLREGFERLDAGLPVPALPHADRVPHATAARLPHACRSQHA